MEEEAGKEGEGESGEGRGEVEERKGRRGRGEGEGEKGKGRRGRAWGRPSTRLAMLTHLRYVRSLGLSLAVTLGHVFTYSSHAFNCYYYQCIHRVCYGNCLWTVSSHYHHNYYFLSFIVIIIISIILPYKQLQDFVCWALAL